jgi:hypothetical protein
VHEFFAFGIAISESARRMRAITDAGEVSESDFSIHLVNGLLLAASGPAALTDSKGKSAANGYFFGRNSSV